MVGMITTKLLSSRTCSMDGEVENLISFCSRSVVHKERGAAGAIILKWV
jgi:hypothetical protein